MHILRCGCLEIVWYMLLESENRVVMVLSFFSFVFCMMYQLTPTSWKRIELWGKRVFAVLMDCHDTKVNLDHKVGSQIVTKGYSIVHVLRRKWPNSQSVSSIGISKPVGIGITRTEAPHLVDAHTNPSKMTSVIFALESALSKITTAKIILKLGGVTRSIPCAP